MISSALELAAMDKIYEYVLTQGARQHGSESCREFVGTMLKVHAKYHANELFKETYGMTNKYFAAVQESLKESFEPNSKTAKETVIKMRDTLEKVRKNPLVRALYEKITEHVSDDWVLIYNLNSSNKLHKILLYNADVTNACAYSDGDKHQWKLIVKTIIAPNSSGPSRPGTAPRLYPHASLSLNEFNIQVGHIQTYWPAAKYDWAVNIQTSHAIDYLLRKQFNEAIGNEISNMALKKKKTPG